MVNVFSVSALYMCFKSSPLHWACIDPHYLALDANNPVKAWTPTTSYNHWKVLWTKKNKVRWKDYSCSIQIHGLKMTKDKAKYFYSLWRKKEFLCLKHPSMTAFQSYQHPFKKIQSKVRQALSCLRRKNYVDFVRKFPLLSGDILLFLEIFQFYEKRIVFYKLYSRINSNILFAFSTFFPATLSY